MSHRRLVFAVGVLLLACGPSDGLPPGTSETVLQEANAAMAAYLSAQAARDGSLMSTFYLDSPDFEALMNGNRQDLGATRTSNVEYYASLRDISGGWTSLRTVALGPEVVVVSAGRDQTMTDTAGVAVRHTGAASWVWVKRGGRWQILQISSHFDQMAGE